MTPELPDIDLREHLQAAHNNVPAALAKSAILIAPRNDDSLLQRARPLKEKQNRWLDETRTSPHGAFGYAVVQERPEPFNWLSNRTPPKVEGKDNLHAVALAYVFDVTALRKAKLETNMATCQDVKPAIAAAGREATPAVGYVQLYSSYAPQNGASAKPREAETVIVHEADMFLVNDKLVPARDWMEFGVQERSAHLSMAGQRGLV